MLRRTLSTYRRRVLTHKSSRKSAKRGHLRSMPYIHMGNNYEKTECIGHELEAFQNFAVYADRYETSPLFHYTDDMNDLTTHEKMEALLNRMHEMWKGKDAPAMIHKLRHCVALAQCFEELCEKDDALLSDYTEDYQHRFYDTVEASCRMAKKVMGDYPDAPAALLYIARVCAVVGEDELEQKCLNLSSHLISTMGEGETELEGSVSLVDETKPEQTIASSETTSKKLRGEGPAIKNGQREG